MIRPSNKNNHILDPLKDVVLSKRKEEQMFVDLIGDNKETAIIRRQTVFDMIDARLIEMAVELYDDAWYNSQREQAIIWLNKEPSTKRWYKSIRYKSDAAYQRIVDRFFAGEQTPFGIDRQQEELEERQQALFERLIDLFDEVAKQPPARASLCWELQRECNQIKNHSGSDPILKVVAEKKEEILKKQASFMIIKDASDSAIMFELNRLVNGLQGQSDGYHVPGSGRGAAIDTASSFYASRRIVGGGHTIGGSSQSSTDADGFIELPSDREAGIAWVKTYLDKRMKTIELIEKAIQEVITNAAD